MRNLKIIIIKVISPLSLWPIKSAKLKEDNMAQWKYHKVGIHALLELTLVKQSGHVTGPSTGLWLFDLVIPLLEIISRSNQIQGSSCSSI